ncbi:MAG TPA: SpvB/TcaC N-terminal domain-containing protein, partial [Mucilaginibacter sp.]|nr:SpvB/TcaC N-terminal domain-containing protein [Mucilaginibacter sp.]
MTNEAWSQETMTIVPPALPDGPATVNGMGEANADAGADGLATLSIPLALCAPRGAAPASGLHYSAAQGNSEWGIGWTFPLARIARSTLHGVPRYQESDSFISPSGEILVPWLNAQGQHEVRRGVEDFQGTGLDQAYSVWRYGEETEGEFSRIERWQGEQNGREFWLLHGTDGSLSCFGRTAQARIADEQAPTHIGEWLLEEWLSAQGEHHYYHFQAEDTSGVSGEEQRQHRARRYLKRIDYGNVNASSVLYCWQDSLPDASECLLHVVFDYGERSLDSSDKPVPPTWAVSDGAEWHKRADSFSDYKYGFELRCHRLCQQVLLFARDPLQQNNPPQLVSSYLLTYHSDEVMSYLQSIKQLAY